MATFADAIRFEILVNGQRRCVAGFEGPGVMSVITDWVIRDPQKKPADFTIDAWTKQSLHCHVGGLSSAANQAMSWLSEDLAVGDEVTIRVLGPGSFDEPLHKSKDNF